MGMSWSVRYEDSRHRNRYWVALIGGFYYYVQTMYRHELPPGRVRRGRNDWKLTVAGDLEVIATGPVWYLKQEAERHANQRAALKALEAME